MSDSICAIIKMQSFLFNTKQIYLKTNKSHAFFSFDQVADTNNLLVWIMNIWRKFHVIIKNVSRKHFKTLKITNDKVSVLKWNWKVLTT